MQPKDYDNRILVSPPHFNEFNGARKKRENRWHVNKQVNSTQSHNSKLLIIFHIYSPLKSLRYSCHIPYSTCTPILSRTLLARHLNNIQGIILTIHVLWNGNSTHNSDVIYASKGSSEL
ncbi:hypothetical protein ACJX0J_032238, partial [Zea mays]